METPATRASWHAHRQLEFVDAFWGADLVNAGYKFICLSLSLCPCLIHLGIDTVNTYENKNLSPKILKQVVISKMNCSILSEKNLKSRI